MKYDACIASVASTAGAAVITTKDAFLYGVCPIGVATTGGQILVSQGKTTGANYVLAVNVNGTQSSLDAPPVPIACANGICATCVGTNFNFIVYYVINE